LREWWITILFFIVAYDTDYVVLE